MMRSGPFCDEPGCPGYHYKFDDCQTEAAYVLTLDGMFADEQDGDVEFEGHYSLMIVTDPIPVDLDGRVVTLKRGNYIVWSTDQGFVYLLTYDNETLARQDFTVARDRYSAWLDVED